MEFTRPLLRQLRNEIAETLNGFAEKHGFAVEVGNASFSDDNATFKLNLATISENGAINTAMASDFKLYCNIWGMSLNDLGKQFTGEDGHTYTLIGAKPRSKKYPLVAKRTGGNSYKFRVDAVKKLLHQVS